MTFPSVRDRRGAIHIPQFSGALALALRAVRAGSILQLLTLPIQHAIASSNSTNEEQIKVL